MQIHDCLLPDRSYMVSALAHMLILFYSFIRITLELACYSLTVSISVLEKRLADIQSTKCRHLWLCWPCCSSFNRAWLLCIPSPNTNLRTRVLRIWQVFCSSASSDTPFHWYCSTWYWKDNILVHKQRQLSTYDNGAFARYNFMIITALLALTCASLYSIKLPAI